MSIRVTPSGQACGAEITGVDLGATLDDETIAEIRSAWLDHKVLVFPDQELTDQELEAFTLKFGPFGDDPFFEPIEGHPHIAAIHRAADETASIFADVWHADWSFQKTPPDGTCLYGKIIPPVGGNTQFANQQAALEAMPAELRDRLEGHMAIHSARFGYAPDGAYGVDDTDERAMKIVYSDEAYETQTHPFIRTHPETGAETLYSTMGYIIGIEGIDDENSRDLLVELWQWQTKDEFQYLHEWQANMLVMWDNRCVLHKANGGYDGHERLLHRATIGYNPAVRTALE